MIDYSTPVGQVRLLTSDLDENAFLLDDAIIEGYLTLNGQDVNLAAADVLTAIATSEVLVAKKIRTQDLSSDGPAVAAVLMQQASALRERAAAILAADQEVFFGVVSMAQTPLEGEEYRL